MAITTKTPPTQAVEASTVRSILAWQDRSGQSRHAITGGATFESAMDALRANRVRSFLTMLGVIMGISAVIAVVTLTQGVNKSVNDRFAGLGTNVITIIPGTTTGNGVRTAAGSNQTLTLADATALMQIPTVVNVSPVLNASEQVIYQDQNWSTSVRGVYPSYQTIQNWQIAEGAWFSDQDEQLRAPVAILGQTVIQNLFPAGIDPVGQSIRIGNSDFHVIGVLQTKGSQGAANSDDVIFVPFSTANERLNPSQYVNQIQVQVDNINDITQTQQYVTSILRARHHLAGPDPSLQSGANGQRSGSLGAGLTGGGGGGYRGGQGGGGGGFQGGGGGGQGGSGGFQGGGGGSGSGQGGQQAGGTASTRNRAAAGIAADPPNDFQIFNVNQIIQTAQQNSTILTILLIAIAAISLAVGGIGIMNIMLVSVTERIREIGIRMAIGARRRDIRNQFLAEAVMLSAVGGIIGIVIGLGGGFALTLGLGLPLVLSPIPALVAFSVSAAVGITFGLYPAVRAARLDPIEALRTT
ncbi:MAG: ABC transporter permease [Chloroflexi bacterium]|nr:ABC transporter permease [Chloroflexota bacterium]